MSVCVYNRTKGSAVRHKLIFNINIFKRFFSGVFSANLVIFQVAAKYLHFQSLDKSIQFQFPNK